MTKKERIEIILTILKKLYPHPKPALNYSTNFELLLAVMFSAQTTDKQVNIMTSSLFNKYPSIEAFAKADLVELQEDMNSIGFYKNKAKYAINTAQIILETYDKKLPTTMEEMTSLPGVGRKTANVVLGYALGISYGVAVDTHVKRLAKKFKLTKHTNPEKIEKDLMKLLDKSEWITFTNRMIDYGREYSPAHKVNDNTDPISVALSL